MTSVERLRQLENAYGNAEDPGALFVAQVQDIIRAYAMALDLCDACKAKFHDPLEAPPGRPAPPGIARPWMPAVRRAQHRTEGR